MHNLALKLGFFSELFIIFSASSLCRGLRTGVLCSPACGPEPEKLLLPTFAGSQPWVVFCLGYFSPCTKQEAGISGCHQLSFRTVPSSLWHHSCVDSGPAGCWTWLQPPAFLCVGFTSSVCLLKLCIKPIFSTKEQSHIGCASRLLHTFYFWSVLLLFSWWEIKKVLLRLFWMPQKLQVAFCSEFQNSWVALCW